MDAPGRSDSSDQVLRNSRPEFRLPGAMRRGSYQIEYFISGVEVFLAWMREFRLLGVCVTWIKARKHILQYYFRQPGGIIFIRFYRNILITWYL